MHNNNNIDEYRCRNIDAGKTHEVGKRSMKKEHRIKKVFIRK